MSNSYTIRYTVYILGAFLLFIVLSYIVIPDHIAGRSNISARLLPPGPNHVLGTDNLGRDLLLILVIGTRNSMILSLTSLSISLAIGTILGMIASTLKHGADFLDNVMVLLNAIPTIFIVAIVAMTYGLGPLNVVLAIVLNTIPLFYRITKTATTNVLVQPYIEALKAIGATDLYILIYHAIKEIMPYLSSLYILSIPTAIAIEMSLNFIGLGLETSSPSLGTIISCGVTNFVSAPHIIVVAMATVIAVLVVFSRLTESVQNLYI